MNNEQLAKKYYLVFGNNPVTIDEWDILVKQMRVPLQEEKGRLLDFIRELVDCDDDRYNRPFYYYKAQELLNEIEK